MCAESHMVGMPIIAVYFVAHLEMVIKYSQQVHTFNADYWHIQYSLPPVCTLVLLKFAQYLSNSHKLS